MLKNVIALWCARHLRGVEITIVALGWVSTIYSARFTNELICFQNFTVSILFRLLWNGRIGITSTHSQLGA